MLRIRTAIVLTVFFGSASVCSAALTDYVVTSGGQFGTVGLTNGAYTHIANLGFTPDGLARTADGTLYAVDSVSNLRTVDTSTGASSVVGSLGNGIQGIVASPDGTLFGYSGSSLYTINPASGAATLVGSFGTSFSQDSMAFDTTGNAYLEGGGATGNTSLYRIDTATGAATLVGATGFRITSLDYESGRLYGFGTNGIDWVSTTTGAGTYAAGIFLSNPGAPHPQGNFVGAVSAAAVPEPGSLALLIIGGLGFGGTFWRRRRAGSPA